MDEQTTTERATVDLVVKLPDGATGQPTVSTVLDTDGLIERVEVTVPAFPPPKDG